MTDLIIKCPHCLEEIIIKTTEINCAIFRHGIYKKTMEQINPHMNKIHCDNLKSKDLIYGCGKPFKLINDSDNSFKAIICDYI